MKSNVKKILKKIIPHRFKRGLPNSRDFVLKSMPSNSICAEVGVLRGGFSKRILRIVEPKKLHLIDAWKITTGDVYKDSPLVLEQDQHKMDKNFEIVLERFKTEIKSGQISIEHGKSEEMLQKFEDNYFDWIYVDANHSYDFVKKDLEACYPKVKKNGFITGDDYGYEGKWWGENTTKAVDEFIKKGYVKLIKVKNHQYILQKI